MAKINTHDIGYGFWLGLGLLLAFAVWGFVTMLAGRAVKRG